MVPRTSRCQNRQCDHEDNNSSRTVGASHDSVLLARYELFEHMCSAEIRRGPPCSRKINSPTAKQHARLLVLRSPTHSPNHCFELPRVSEAECDVCADGPSRDIRSPEVGA